MNTNHGPKNNNVLVKVRLTNDKIVLNNGGHLFIDTSFDPERHTNIVGDVIEVPDIVSHEEILVGGGRKRVEDIMELKVGDVVYMHYLAIQNALKNKFDSRAWMENGELYVLVRYFDVIFMAIRDGSPMMINDYILVEPSYKELKEIKERFSHIGVEVPEQTLKFNKEHTQYGVVVLTGKNLFRDSNFTDEELCAGKEVLFQKNADIPLEYELHQTFEKGKKLFRIRRKDILMVLE